MEEREGQEKSVIDVADLLPALFGNGATPGL